MKRKRLAELVREEAGDLQEAPAPREERAGEAPHGGGLEGSPPGEGQGERPLPPYLTYVRKECRLRPDQLDALTALARRLNRERKGKGGKDHGEHLNKVGSGSTLRALPRPSWSTGG